MASWMDIEAGRYLAKAKRARFDSSPEKGSIFIEVEFWIPEINQNIRWKGYLTEKTIEKTMETMALLEWNNDDTFADGSISTEKEVLLVIDREEGSNGKEYPRVRWVNDPSKSKFDGLDPSAIKTKLGSLDLKAEMAAARKRLGMNGQRTAEPAPQTEDVPF